MRASRFVPASLVLLIVLVAMPVLASGIPIQNWTPNANADLGHTSPFQSIAPCRLVDTRYGVGGPATAFAANETRHYTIATSTACSGIPVAEAYSLNFTIVGYTGSFGWITAWPYGATKPTVSTVNFGNGAAVANAAVVPANTSNGAISIYASGATHLLVDINGYYTNEQTAGKQLFILANYPGMAAIYGHNDSSVNGSQGVGGYADGTGVVHGVQGGTAGGAGSSGVHGYNAPIADTYGVFGEALGNVLSFGVKGVKVTYTTNSAGVLGVLAGRVTPAMTYYGVGVRGESTTGMGVLGLSTESGGPAIGGGRWDMTTNPPVNTSQGILAYEHWGVQSYGDFAATGTKNFVDPHPDDATKVVRFTALEGPEAATFFRGRSRFVAGHAVIAVPEAFRLVTEADGLTVHVTPIGKTASVAVISADLNNITVEATRDVEFSYIVYGVRKGYANFEPIVEESLFVPRSPGEVMPAYLNPAQKKSLMSNGTYNEDGTVNMTTALRLGWDRLWKQQQ